MMLITHSFEDTMRSWETHIGKNTYFIVAHMSSGHIDVEILATAKADVYREMSVESWIQTLKRLVPRHHIEWLKCGIRWLWSNANSNSTGGESSVIVLRIEPTKLRWLSAGQIPASHGNIFSAFDSDNKSDFRTI